MLYHKKNISHILTFLVMIIIGWLLHKSSFMVLFLFAMSFVPLKKVLMQISILSLPIAVIFVKIVIPMIFANYFEDSTYIDAEETSSTIGSVKRLITLGFNFVFGFYILRQSKGLCKSGMALKMYRIVYWAFYLWCVFYFSGASRFIGERLYAHASLPLFYLVCLLFQNSRLHTRQTLLLFFAAYILIQQLGILVVWAYHEPYLLSNQYI